LFILIAKERLKMGKILKQNPLLQHLIHKKTIQKNLLF